MHAVKRSEQGYELEWHEGLKKKWLGYEHEWHERLVKTNDSRPEACSKAWRS